MKKIIFIINFCFVLLLSQGIAQTPLQKQIESTSAGLFSKEDLFFKKSGTNRAQTLNQYIKNYEILEVNTSALSRIASNTIANLEIDIPMNGSQVTLQLMKSKVVDENTVFITQNGKVDYQPGAYFNGIIKGRSNSLVAISFFNNSIIGIIANEQGNYVLGNSNTQDRNSNEYLLYNDKDLLVKNNFQCYVDSEMETAGLPLVPHERAGSAKCVKVYLEADYDLYTEIGNVNSTINFVTSVFNITSALYLNESISMGISSIKVWTTSDPYASATTTATALDLFKNNMNNGFTGNLAHLLSSKSWGGGRAHLDVLCSSTQGSRTAVSGDLWPYAPPGFPTYSWDVGVVTHEIGHNLGSRHTHACAWNGNNTAIDGCGPAAGYPTEGGCATPPLPPSGGGTIMSYCHLSSTGVGINFNWGFGPQPGDLIRSKVAGASCVQLCCPSDITFASLNYQTPFTLSETWIKSNGQTHISNNSNVVLDANPANGYVLLGVEDYYDYFLSDPTASGSFTAKALYGCIMPLSVYISGPNQGNNSGTYTWTAVVSLPSSQIASYAWSYSYNGVNYTPTGGNSSSITQQLPSNMNIYFRVTVTSIDGQTATDDFFVTNLDAKIPTNIKEYDPYAKMSISPNPNNGSFSLTVPNQDEKSIFVYDFMGKIVFKEESLRENTLQVDITNQPAGIYLIKMISGENVISKKVIVQ